jgi:pectinesterase
MRPYLPALLVLAISAGAWSCSSSGSGEADGAAGHAAAGAGGSLGLAGAVGAAGSGTVATGGSVGTAGTSSATGGSVGTAGMASAGFGNGGGGATAGAGTAGSATGGSGTAGAGTGTAGAGTAGAGTAGAGAGGTGAGGRNGVGGGGASAGGGSSMAGAPATCGNIANTATRPQLNSTDAAKYTILKYFAQSDNWDPTAGLGNASSFTPNFTVAADGSGTHTTVQAAINAANSGTARRYILIKPGSYRGVVSYTGSTPITLYGADSDATKVVIINSASAAAAGGTDKSATFTSKSAGLQLLNLTVSNDFATPATGTNIQAVALYVTGDKTVLQNVRLHGFQDTLFTDLPSETAVTRVYIKSSFIEGDTDFIFGAATLVIDSSSINYLSSRKTGGGGACLAPSTRVAQNYGFLVINSQFTAEAGAIANKVSLGRSWDEGGVTPTPNGQAVVRESTLGAHIRKVDPWAAAATSSRAFSATGNRFSEYCNSGVGSGP